MCADKFNQRASCTSYQQSQSQQVAELKQALIQMHFLKTITLIACSHLPLMVQWTQSPISRLFKCKYSISTTLFNIDEQK